MPHLETLQWLPSHLEKCPSPSIYKACSFWSWPASLTTSRPLLQISRQSSHTLSKHCTQKSKYSATAASDLFNFSQQHELSPGMFEALLSPAIPSLTTYTKVHCFLLNHCSSPRSTPVPLKKHAGLKFFNLLNYVTLLLSNKNFNQVKYDILHQSPYYSPTDVVSQWLWEGSECSVYYMLLLFHLTTNYKLPHSSFLICQKKRGTDPQCFKKLVRKTRVWRRVCLNFLWSIIASEMW